MVQLLSDYIFKKNFTAFGLKLCVRNETSHTLFTKGESIFIRELKEAGLVLEIPGNVCQKGHNLTLFFFTQDFEEKISLPVSGHYKEALFEVMAKVDKLDINKENKEQVFVELRFTQYDQANWKKIIKLFEKNQEHVTDLIAGQHKKRAMK